jgi:hypothetical protein
MPMKWILFALFISTTAEATTCFTTDEDVFLWNQKYQSLFDVETRMADGDFVIEVNAPSNLDKSAFDNVVLIFGNEEHPSLFVPLQTYDVDGKKVTWYTVAGEMVRKQTLAFSYGDGCGITVTVPVIFN